MIISIAGDLTDFLAENSGSVQQLLDALAERGIYVETTERFCRCGADCGYLLGDVSCGYYVGDVWVWELVRYQWWRTSEHTPEEAQLDAIERLVRLLLRKEVLAAGTNASWSL